MFRSSHERMRAAVVVLSVVLAGGVGPALAGMIPVDVVPSTSTVVEGDTFSVSFMADSAEPLVAFGFHLVFDDSLVTLDSVTVAAPYKPISVPGAPLTKVWGYAIPNAPSGNNILLATAVFTAVSTGAPTVTLGVTPGGTEGFVQEQPTGDGSGGTSPGLAETSVQSTQLTILPPSSGGGGGGGGSPVVPEPMTVLFLLGGLLAMRSRRIR